jgi:capsular polysaccharide biosynthesis protein
VAVIDHAIVCGEGIICKKTSRGILAVAETLINASSERSILPLKRCKDDVLYADKNIGRRKLSTQYTYAFLRQVYDGNYGHWITEVLPKVAVLAEHFDIKSLKFIVARHMATGQFGPMRKICVDSLAAFGVKSQQILPMTRKAVEIERLLYPLPLTVHPWVKAPRAIQILEGLRDKIAIGHRGPRRLYVSRALARKRRLLNEAEILPVLRDFDVSVVYPERHSFVEQVRLFADAELVIGNCGANLTNAVFSPRGVAIFVIAPEAMADDFFWDLANLKSGKYISLHGKAACTSPDMDSDFFIDPGEFRALLEKLVRKDR